MYHCNVIIHSTYDFTLQNLRLGPRNGFTFSFIIWIFASTIIHMHCTIIMSKKLSPHAISILINSARRSAETVDLDWSLHAAAAQYQLCTTARIVQSDLRVN